MRSNGQSSLEVLIVLVFFIALLGFGFSLMKGKRVLAMEKVNVFNAKSNALACGILLNGFFSNSAEEISGFEVNCFFGEENEVVGKFGGEEKEAFSLTNGEFLGEGSEKKIIVKKLEHYR